MYKYVHTHTHTSLSGLSEDIVLSLDTLQLLEFQSHTAQT